MITYPVGQEPDFWDPNPADARHRFALGRIGGSSPSKPPLIVIGMNPSRARESESDRTVNRVIRASEEIGGYDGWLMLNLYPERSPKPSALGGYDRGRSDANCAAIVQVLRQLGATEVLGAWGNMGGSATLRRALSDVRALLAGIGVHVFTMDPLTRQGNPRHPQPPGRPLPMLGPKAYLP
ncbi:hypothetical protein GCM10009786_11740 [Leucobacter alluvii]|uniref:DUF1643 domain-containing protein n=1 Tax=Leucobacter alluvii TaxID=340321 RepID=A0ABP5MYK0_9MICO